MENNLYSLDELIEVLEEIKKNGDGNLNFPKAFYCIAMELKELKRRFSEES